MVDRLPKQVPRRWLAASPPAMPCHVHVNSHRVKHGCLGCWATASAKTTPVPASQHNLVCVAVFPGFNARLALACSGEIVPLPLRRALACAGLSCVAQPPLIGRGRVPSAFPFPLLATPCTLPSSSAVLVAARLQRLTATHGKLDRWWHRQKEKKTAVWLSGYVPRCCRGPPSLCQASNKHANANTSRSRFPAGGPGSSTTQTAMFGIRQPQAAFTTPRAVRRECCYCSSPSLPCFSYSIAFTTLWPESASAWPFRPHSQCRA
jgi:hypothetical protein